MLEFFGLECVPVENLFLRGNDIRNVYLVSDGVRDILLSSSDLQPVIAGVRIFEENRYLKTCDCELRLAQAGVQLLASSMRRRCEASYDDLLTLLKGEVVKFTDFPQGSLLRSSLEGCRVPGERGCRWGVPWELVSVWRPKEERRWCGPSSSKKRRWSSWQRWMKL